MVSIGPPGVDPEPAPMQPMINIQVETVAPPPAAVKVQAPPAAQQPPQDQREVEEEPMPREVRLPLALEHALAFKTERAKQVGVRPDELGETKRFALNICP